MNGRQLFDIIYEAKVQAGIAPEPWERLRAKAQQGYEAAAKQLTSRKPTGTAGAVGEEVSTIFYNHGMGLMLQALVDCCKEEAAELSGDKKKVWDKAAEETQELFERLKKLF